MKSKHWNTLSIGNKFNLCFSGLFAFLFMIVLLSYFNFIKVLDETQQIITKNIELQQSINRLRIYSYQIKDLETNFLPKYKKLGFKKTYQQYISPIKNELQKITNISLDLNKVDLEDFVQVLQQKIILQKYLSLIKQQIPFFDETIQYVSVLVAQKKGFNYKLQQASLTLNTKFNDKNRSEMDILKQKISFYEKEYWKNKKTTSLELLQHYSKRIQNQIKKTESNSVQQKLRLPLQEYLQVITQIIAVDISYQKKLYEFNPLNSQLEPLSKKLLELSKENIQQANQKRFQVRQLFQNILIGLILIALVCIILIARILNKAIRKNFIKLIRAVKEIESGKGNVIASVQSNDELGFLAKKFNKMAFHVHHLVDGLESTVIEKTTILSKTNEQLQDEVQKKELAVTALQRSYTRYDALASNVPGLIFQMIIDPSKTIHFPYVSQSVETIYGFSSRELQDQPELFFQSIHDDDLSEVKSLLNKSKDNLEHWHQTWRIVKNDQIIWVHGSSKPDQLDDGSTLWDGLIVDITQQKEAEEELRKAKDTSEKATLNAQKANQAKSEFLSKMSHEIRTPMNAILDFTEILEEQISDSEQKSYLSAIMSSGKTLLNLINDILDLSKVESGKLLLYETLVQPRKILQEIYKIFIPKTQRKKIELVLDIDTQVPKYLVLDEKRFQQICFNLIENAVKFTNIGFVKISLLTDFINESHCNLVVVVEDSGVGISQNQQNDILGEFEQQKEQSSIFYKGIGLGLSITKHVVKAMGGEIAVFSEVGNGSQLTVAFKNIKVGTQKELPLSSINLSKNKVQFQAAKILIVDDLPFNRELLSKYLQAHNVQIFTAMNGQECIEKVKLTQPDIILMDMIMPVMNGYQASKILKDDPQFKHIPIIAVTATTMKNSEQEIQKLCDSYITKPISKTSLFKELMNFLPHQIKKEVH